MKAQKIIMQDVQGAVKQLRSGLKTIEGQMKKKPTPGDRFADVMGPFAEKISSQIEKAEKDIAKCVDTSDSLIQSYGEDPKKLVRNVKESMKSKSAINFIFILSYIE